MLKNYNEYSQKRIHQLWLKIYPFFLKPFEKITTQFADFPLFRKKTIYLFIDVFFIFCQNTEFLIFFSFLKNYLLLKCSHRTSESFCKMQIFGQPRVRGRRMYSEALNKDSHEYDKGDTHK